MRRKILLASAACVGLMWIYFLVTILVLPPVTALRTQTPHTTAYMEHTKGVRDIERIIVPLKDISPHLRRAVIVAEDGRFYEHMGFDWDAIKEAYAYNMKRHRFSVGASTITMQLARNLFLSPAKTPSRKLRELLIALKMELLLSKDRILELYLNSIEWGNGIFGAEAASQHYFGINAKNLDAEQAIFLAAILPRPLYYEKRPHDPRLVRRMSKIRRHFYSANSFH